MTADNHILLTIAGSDSTSGAGIQADIRVATLLGVYPLTAVTAVTAQSSRGILRSEAVSPETLRLQLSCASEHPLGAIKVGMIPSAALANVIADFLLDNRSTPVVIDPVMFATSGACLSQSDAVTVLRDRLIPCASLLTPNIPEAELIAGRAIRNPDDAAAAAKMIINELGCRAVLVKGGHMPTDGRVTDILVSTGTAGFRSDLFTHSIVKTRNTHGTGCTLSSAIASYLAKGEELNDAVGLGIDFLYNALIEGATCAFGSTEGHGPALFKTNQINLQ